MGYHGILCVRDRNRIVFLGCSGVPHTELLRRPIAGTDVAASVIETDMFYACYTCCSASPSVSAADQTRLSEPKSGTSPPTIYRKPTHVPVQDVPRRRRVEFILYIYNIILYMYVCKPRVDKNRVHPIARLFLSFSTYPKIFLNYVCWKRD